MQQHPTPYAAHVWVCTNQRAGGSKACGNELGMALKDALKSSVEARGWKGRVRVSHSDCMGLCARGPIVMVHPFQLWFAGVSPADVPAILDEIGRRLPPG